MSNEHGATPAGGDAAVQRTRKEIATDRLTPVFRDGNGGANQRVLKSGMKSCTRAKLARSQRGTKWKTPFHKGYQ